MSKRIADVYEVPQERVGGGDCVITAEMYNVRPALFITREVSYAGFKRTADRPYPPPTYTVKTDGCVVGETRFDDLAAAEAYSAEKKRELAERQGGAPQLAFRHSAVDTRSEFVTAVEAVQ